MTARADQPCRPAVLGREARSRPLQDITARDLTPADVIAVGDGANDLGMLQLAEPGSRPMQTLGRGAQVDVQINHGDLTALLYLGYAAEEFVD